MQKYYDKTPTQGSTNPVTSDALNTQLTQIGLNLDEVEAEIGYKIEEFSFSAAGEKEYRFVEGNTYLVTNIGSSSFTISIRETKDGESHDATNVSVGKSVEITASIDGYWVRVGTSCAFSIVRKGNINSRLNTVEASTNDLNSAQAEISIKLDEVESDVKELIGGEVESDHTNDAFGDTQGIWTISNGSVQLLTDVSQASVRAIASPIPLAKGSTVLLTTASYSIYQPAYILATASGTVITSEKTASSNVAETFTFSAASDCLLYINKVNGLEFSCKVTSHLEGRVNVLEDDVAAIDGRMDIAEDGLDLVKETVGYTVNVNKLQSGDVEFTSGAVIFNTGQNASSDNFKRTGFIDIDGYTNLEFLGYISNKTGHAFGYAFYSSASADSFISGIRADMDTSLPSYSEKVIKTVIPSGAKYVRMSMYKDYVQDWYMTAKDDTKTVSERLDAVESSAQKIQELDAVKETLGYTVNIDKLDKSNVTISAGAVVGSNGTNAESVNFKRTDFISIEGYTKVEFLGYIGNSTGHTFGCAFYSSASVDSYISGKVSNVDTSLDSYEETVYSLDIPDGAKYIRVTIYNSFLDDWYMKLRDGSETVAEQFEGLSKIVKWVDDNGYAAINLTDQFVIGSYIKTNVAVGEVVSSTPITNGSFVHIIVPCKAGDSFDIIARGASAPRAYAFVDAEWRLLEVARQDASVNENGHYATVDGYCIVNSDTSLAYSLTHHTGSVAYLLGKEEELSASQQQLSSTVNSIKSDISESVEFTDIPKTSVTPHTFQKGKSYRVTNNGNWFMFSIRETTISDSYNVAAMPKNRVYDFIAEIDASYIRIGAATDATVSFTVERLDTIDARLSKMEYNPVEYAFQFGKACSCRYTAPVIPALVMPSDRLAYFYGLFDDLLDRFPNYIRKVDCDAEVSQNGIEVPEYMEGYPIYMYNFVPSYTPNSSIKDNHNTAASRLKVFILGGTHPEYMGIWDLYHTMRLICEEWENDDNLDELRWNCEFYVMPCSSPYGVKKGSRINYNGVDLNRNAPALNWTLTEEGTATYSGPEPASEYETKVLVYYMESIKPNVFIDHHNTNTGSGDAEGDNKNLMYITSKFQFGVDIGAAHISQMTRAWKKRFTDLFPSNAQDPITIYGFTQKTREPGTRGVYACESGALGFTYESNQACLYRNGEYSTANRQTNTSEVSTMATDGFVNFLLRALKSYSEAARIIFS